VSVDANPHLSIPPVFAGTSPSQARCVAVLVHGRNQDEQVMLDVVERLALPDIAYVLPIAAQRSWYPYRYFDPVADSEPDVRNALAAIEADVTGVMDDAASDAGLVLCGFSQGACLIAELVARRVPPRLSGVAVLTGSLIGAPGEWRAPAPAEGLPMFVSCAQDDQWVAVGDAQATAEAFQRAGAAVTFEILDDREHLISDRAVAGLRSLLQRA
jgi:phospholipase/carboxylesterase